MSVSKKQTMQDRIVRSLREKRMLLPVAFLLTLLIDIGILYGIVHAPQNFCIGIVGIGVLTPFAFIWFRINDPKKLFILVTVIFLLITPIFAGMATDQLYSADPTLYSKDKAMKDGKVTPYIGKGETGAFNFTLVVSSNSNSTVYLNLTDMKGKAFNYTMLSMDNMTYYKELNLDKGIYIFYFSLKKSNHTSTEWEYTLGDYGPLNMEKNEYLLLTILPALLATFMYFGFLSYILIGMYWWTRIAKEKKRRMVTVRRDEGGLKCPVCGNSITEGTSTCPYCGAELEYEEEKEDESNDEGVGEYEGQVEANEPEE